MRRLLLAVIVALVWVHALPAGPVREVETPSSMLGAKGLDGEWVRRFEAEWRALSHRGELPARTVAYVLGVIRREWLPEDPSAAAADIYDMARQAEIRRLGGEPLFRIGAELRREMMRSGSGAGAGHSRGAPGGLNELRSWRADAAQESRRLEDEVGGRGDGGGGTGNGDGDGGPSGP